MKINNKKYTISTKDEFLNTLSELNVDKFKILTNSAEYNDILFWLKDIVEKNIQKQIIEFGHLISSEDKKIIKNTSKTALREINMYFEGIGIIYFKENQKMIDLEKQELLKKWITK